MIDHLVTLLDSNYPGSEDPLLHAHIKFSCQVYHETVWRTKKNKTGGDASEIDDDVADDLAAAFDELEEELEDEDRGDWEYDMRADMVNEDVEKLEENVKLVQRALSKVSWFVCLCMWYSLFAVTEGHIRYQEFNNHYSPWMVCGPQSNGHSQ